MRTACAVAAQSSGLRDREIADVLLVNPATVARARKRYVEEGLEAAINDRLAGPGAQAGRPAGSAPDRLCVQRRARRSHVGHSSCWPMVELEFAESISLETLKKTNSSPGRRKSGVSPRCGEFVARMEDWDLYQPEQSGASGMCFDETSRQLTGRCVRPSRLPPDGWHAMTSTSETGPGTCS